MAFLPLLITLNLVGYDSKDAGTFFNYYTPQFTNPGETTIDINIIQLDDGGAGLVGWGDSMQIVGPLGGATATYLYYDKSMNPKGEAAGNFWGDDGLAPVDVSFDSGEGIVIDNANGLSYKICGAGQVQTEEVKFAAHQFFNNSGNPFSAPININNIQLDDGGAGLVGWGDSMQIVGPLGGATATYLYYDKSMNPKGEAAGNFWGDDGLAPVDVSFNPGDGFTIDNANGLTFDIVITPPYSL